MDAGHGPRGSIHRRGQGFMDRRLHASRKHHEGSRAGEDRGLLRSDGAGSFDHGSTWISRPNPKREAIGIPPKLPMRKKAEMSKGTKLILKTKLTEQYGVDLPFVNAGMAFIATSGLAAAVARAGGLGTIGCAAMSPDFLRDEVRRIPAQPIDPLAWT